ncbi:MAG: homoserine dehydrogenase [Clostridia bacterium]|nr:homoserine dehydrogenase [Clostridia bacterium]
MRKVGVAILGLGVVGGGTYKVLTEHREFYKSTQKVDISVECVLEPRKERLLELGIDENIICSSIAEVCSNPDVEIVVEVMGGVEPAKEYVLAALRNGKSVVTSNKELYCKYGYELEETAKKHNCGIFYEATCVGGVPVIRTLLDNLQGNEISSLMGIINGTTNYILTKMTSDGMSYDDALAEAQALGYAEKNPEADVEGFDAVYKLSILSSLAFHTKIPYEKIYREGIKDVCPIDIQYGRQLGYVMKLLAIAKNTSSGVEVRVHPTFISGSHPLAAVGDNFNAVYITGDSIGDTMLYGLGAGEFPTASAVVGDIIYCATHDNYNYSPFSNTQVAGAVRISDNFRSSYYIRVEAEDRSGVLSKIASAFSRQSISVARVVQDDVSKGSVPMILVTHPTNENSVRKAVEEINESSLGSRVVSIIRVAG